MTLDDFKTGDTVQLNSGGPLMTVTDISKRENKVYCVWFVGTKTEYGNFPPAALKKAAN